ncbi:MAG: hypothetical protein AB1896_22975, partial [Thermodesulfobacteriota bacterium]
LAQLSSFQQTVSRTLARYRKEGAAASGNPEELRGEADRLLGEVTYWRYLAVREDHRTELETMEKRLAEGLERDGLSPAGLEEMTRRLAELHPQVENAHLWRAYRRTLAEALTRRLGEMGYRTVEGFAEIEDQDWVRAAVAVPGGERLTVALGSDGRLNFTLAHERRDSNLPLTPEEIEFYRRQEDRWSLDFRELIRRLTKEGFSYQVRSEQPARSDSIPIVVVETAEDLAALEDESARGRDEPRKRTH